MKKILSKSRDFLHNEDGAVIVLIALVFTVLLGFVALAIDVGVAIITEHCFKPAVMRLRLQLQIIF